MKKLLLMALFLALGAGALAEVPPAVTDGEWTSREEPYYHDVECCGGEAGRVPISQAGAAAFGKAACPVCVPEEDDGAPPAAVTLGGMICIRFSDAWLARRELISVLGAVDARRYEGGSAQTELTELLHGAAYADFLESGAEEWALVPEVLDVDDFGQESCEVLARRHVGAHWYVLVRPVNGFEETWRVYWRVSARRLRMENGALCVSEERYSREDTPLTPEAVFSCDAGLSTKTYAAGELYVAALRADFPGEMELRIAGAFIQTVSSGGEVSFALLTEAELNALRESGLEYTQLLRKGGWQ